MDKMTQSLVINLLVGVLAIGGLISFLEISRRYKIRREKELDEEMERFLNHKEEKEPNL